MQMRIAIGVSVLVATAAGACATTGLTPGSGNWAALSDSGAFVTMLGRDTLAMERFVMHGTTMEIEALTRSPQTMMRRARLEWTSEGELRAYEATAWEPAGAPGQPSLAIVRQGDSLAWTMRGAQGTRTQMRPAVNAIAVFTPPLLSPYAAMARMAFARGDATVLQTSAGMGNFEMRVSRPAAEWLALSHPELGTVRVRMDARGRAHEIDATQTTLGTRAVRVSGLDIAGWARTFAARDAAGQGLRLLSPPDSVRAQIGGANVRITYHRPFVRGRTIFGELVPFDRVWRTGANEATGFTTDRDLMIGETRVPAGSYTVWSLPTRDGWHLILNRQTGQWGTQYNPAQDLAHIPMRLERLTVPVEQFTIAVAPDGVLSIAWADRRGTVPIRAAR